MLCSDPSAHAVQSGAWWHAQAPSLVMPTRVVQSPCLRYNRKSRIYVPTLRAHITCPHYVPTLRAHIPGPRAETLSLTLTSHSRCESHTHRINLTPTTNRVRHRLRDLKNKQALREKYNITSEMVDGYEPLSIISIPGYSEMSAETACEALGWVVPSPASLALRCRRCVLFG
jgi:hypothetical protein